LSAQPRGQGARSGEGGGRRRRSRARGGGSATDGDPDVAPCSSTGPARGSAGTSTWDPPSGADWFALVGVCTLAVLVHLNTLANGFTLDDQPIILWNDQVHGIRRILDAVTGPYWPNSPDHLGLYRPVTLLTFAVDWDLWGGRPFGFHLVNVLLHAGVTALVFRLLGGIGAGLIGAVVGAAIFAVHPVHVEAVANVVGRAELLAAGGFLAACLVHLRGSRGWGAAACVGGLYLLSMGSKEIGITLPAVLLLLHFARAGSAAAALESARGHWRSGVALVAALVVYFALRAANIGAAIGDSPAPWFWGEPPATRVWTAIRIWPEYVRLLLFPLELLPDYGPSVILPEPAWSRPLVLLGFLTGGVALAVGLLCWRRARLVSIGLLWFAITVFPVSGLAFPTGILLAERTLYLPSIGLALALAGGIDALRVQRPVWLRPALALLLVLGLGGALRTWVQNPVWRDDASLMRYLVQTRPDNYRAQWALAHDLAARGEFDRALEYMAAALEVVPGYFNLRMEYGMGLFDLGRYEEAADQFAFARELVPEAELTHLLHLVSLVQAGRNEEAVAVGAGVLARLPESDAAHHHLAIALGRIGAWEEARWARTQAIRLDAGALGWEQWVHLAAIEVGAGEAEAALRALVQATERAPPEGEVPTLEELTHLLSQEDGTGIPFW